MIEEERRREKRDTEPIFNIPIKRKWIWVILGFLGAPGGFATWKSIDIGDTVSRVQQTSAVAHKTAVVVAKKTDEEVENSYQIGRLKDLQHDNDINQIVEALNMLIEDHNLLKEAVQGEAPKPVKRRLRQITPSKVKMQPKVLVPLTPKAAVPTPVPPVQLEKPPEEQTGEDEEKQ